MSANLPEAATAFFFNLCEEAGEAAPQGDVWPVSSALCGGPRRTSSNNPNMIYSLYLNPIDPFMIHKKLTNLSLTTLKNRYIAIPIQ